MESGLNEDDWECECGRLTKQAENGMSQEISISMGKRLNLLRGSHKLNAIINQNEFEESKSNISAAQISSSHRMMEAEGVTGEKQAQNDIIDDMCSPICTTDEALESQLDRVFHLFDNSSTLFKSIPPLPEIKAIESILKKYALSCENTHRLTATVMPLHLHSAALGKRIVDIELPRLGESYSNYKNEERNENNPGEGVVRLPDSEEGFIWVNGIRYSIKSILDE